MKISICIPHYNRKEYLLKVLDSVERQTYQDIELVISDDGSSDDSRAAIPARLRNFKFPNRYEYHEINRGYDANLRKSMEMASGDFLFILGNDDALADENSISRLANLLAENHDPDVCFCNFYLSEDMRQVQRRALQTGLAGGGPELALRAFRSFSYVAGLIFKRESFVKHDTAAYDGSVYVQVYLACRILAAGGRLLTIEDPLLICDVHVDGIRANNYRDRIQNDQVSFRPRDGGLVSFTGVVWAAIQPYLKESGKLTGIYEQIYKYTYPYWLYEYRRQRAFHAAVGMMRGCSPSKMLPPSLGLAQRLKLQILYGISSLCGLVLPVSVLSAAKAFFYGKGKRI